MTRGDEGKSPQRKKARPPGFVEKYQCPKKGLVDDVTREQACDNVGIATTEGSVYVIVTVAQKRGLTRTW